MRRTFNRLLIFLPLLALIETSTAQAADPRQVIVVKVSPETDARIIHRAGDPVALLEIDHAPDHIVEVLTHQLGDWCSKIERRGIYGHTVTFALFLRDASVFPTVGWGKKPRSLRLQFTPRPKAMRPKATEVVGRMAGFGSSVEHRYLLPPKPRRHPCKKPVFEDHCAHYKRALEAAQFLEEGKPVDTFERWAFRFRFEKPWTRNLPAYAYTGIVVARLLVHRDLAPEAEAFLRSDPVFAVERHIPYTALILAGIYEKTDRRDEAVEILTEMMKTTKERELRGHATLALLELQIHGRRFVEAAQLAEELTADRAGDGDVAAKSWMLSGEVKIAMGAFDAAETCFRNAMKTVRDRQLEADIHLRLGDLALQNHRARSVARRQYERASKGDECTVKRVELRRMLRFGPFAKYATLEDRVAQLVEFGACPAVRFEATYALAFVHSALGNDLEALQTLIAAKEMKSDFVQAWAVDVAYLSATQQVVGRWIERLARAEAWPEIIGLMEGPVGEVRGSLDAPTLVAISRAHRMMNVDGGFWDDLLVQLRRGLDEEVEREALIELIESYLVAEDTFRADVAIGYFIEQHDDSIDGWRGRQLAARRALLGQRADVALAHLDAVESLTPPGDPLQEAKALRTRALLGAGRTSDAASSLLAWLDGTPTPTQGVGALTVDVTSACLRECNDEQVAQLLKRINTFEDGALVTDRIRVLAKQRGVELRDKAAQEGKGSVWKRYGEVIAASEDLEEIKE